MGISQISLIFLFFSSSFCIAAQKKILLTAFEPFGFSLVNRSLDTAASAKISLEQRGFEVEICTLPVVYDLAATRAKECFESSSPKPALVVSLGEGDCSLRMETAAHNRDSTPGFPDNFGNIRTGTVIDSRVDKSISFRSFVADMYCSAPEYVKKSIKVSESPGGFVCNNTAFHLGSYFAKINIPYTFIHVPSNSCSEDNNLAVRSGKQISKMISSLAFFKQKNTSKSFEDICSHLPLSIKQVEDFLKIIDTYEPSVKKQCGIEFLNKLNERLMKWKAKDSTY